MLEDMTASAFINALRRFIAIRNDRGTNFIGAVNELYFNTINAEDESIENYLTTKERHVFSTRRTPHTWEGIGVSRRILDAMLLKP